MVDRVFLGWNEPLLPKVARGYLDAPPDGVAPVVVVPGARAGRRLVELLLEEAQLREQPLDPPRVTTPGRLGQLLLDPHGRLPPADEVLQRRCWGQALQALPSRYRDRLIHRPSPPDDLSAWDRHARGFLALHRELAAHGLRFPAALAACGSDELLYDDGVRWEALVRLQDSALALLAATGRADGELERMAALEVGVAPGGLTLPDGLWLVGVVELPRVLRRMVEAVAQAGAPVRALIQAPEEVEEGFDALGCVRPDVWRARSIPIPSGVLRFRDRPPGQARELLRFLGELPADVTPDQVSVAVADPGLIPYVQDQASLVGVPTRYAGGIPLEATAPFRFLEAAGQLLGERSYPALADLLRHPHLQLWLEEAGGGLDGEGPGEDGDWLTLADRYARTHLPGTVDLPLAGTRSGGGSRRREVRRARAMEGLRRRLLGPRLLGRMEGSRPLSQWMAPILDLLVELFGRRPLSRGEPSQRVVLEACQGLREVAQMIHQLPASLDPSVSGASALRLFLGLARGRAVPPGAEEESVELLGWLELSLDDAEVVAVLGMNEPFLPESPTADPFLPGALRTRLGLPDSDARWGRDAFHLTALLGGGRQVVLLAGRRSADGDPLRPSRLLLAADPPEVARRVLAFVRGGGEGPGGGVSGGAGVFHLPPHPELEVSTPISSLSVTAFRSVLADPFRFALESIWRLREERDDVAELEPAAFGSLAHEVLQRFGRGEVEASGKAASLEELTRRLEAALQEVVRVTFGRRPLPVVRVQVEQLRHRLRRFAEHHHHWRSAGWTVVGVEVKSEGAGVPFPVDGHPFHLRGQIDRVDWHPELGWALLDYKTSDAGKTPGGVHRRGRGREAEWVDLQLPLYRHFLPHLPLEGVEFTPDDPVRLGYVNLPGREEEAGFTLADWTPEELHEADEVARRVVRLLRGGRFSFQGSPVASRFRDPVGTLLGAGLLRDSPPDGETGVGGGQGGGGSQGPPSPGAPSPAAVGGAGSGIDPNRSRSTESR